MNIDLIKGIVLFIALVMVFVGGLNYGWGSALLVIVAYLLGNIAGHSYYRQKYNVFL